ncbi:MAG: hypothetical protein KAJ73_01135 [Zetaproteobacteria bacterium]|nr:hypothetical protein [Zetaproteobacteria bacterium]
MPKRVDSNQAQVVADLRKCGASVLLLHEVGHGCPDILVGFRGVNYLIEIKHGDGKLNPGQIVWHTLWRGQVTTAFNAEEAMRIIGVLK